MLMDMEYKSTIGMKSFNEGQETGIKFCLDSKFKSLRSF